ncbi:MAG TPA: hypothetical protein VGP48_10220 [Stellaceae bacterium]|nr:hypothetical protein [Stellaceae bacterium]
MTLRAWQSHASPVIDNRTAPAFGTCEIDWQTIAPRAIAQPPAAPAPPATRRFSRARVRHGIAGAVSLVVAVASLIVRG